MGEGDRFGDGGQYIIEEVTLEDEHTAADVLTIDGHELQLAHIGSEWCVAPRDLDAEEIPRTHNVVELALKLAGLDDHGLTAGERLVKRAQDTLDVDTDAERFAIEETAAELDYRGKGR